MPSSVLHREGVTTIPRGSRLQVKFLFSEARTIHKKMDKEIVYISTNVI